MPSEPLIALALSLLISLAPFLPAAEKSAPEEEPARVVEEQPALSAEQLAALAQTPASWFDEPALLDALSKLPHYDETRAQRYLAYRTGGVWTLEQVLRIVNTDNDLPRFTAAVDADPDDGDLILVNKYSRLASDYVPEDLVTVEPAYSNGGKLKSEVNDAFCDLVEAMWAETGLHLVNASPYRSYQTQKNLYARYRTQYSEATTDRFSARAGYSEHQTGLALDVIAPGGTLNGFKNTQQFVWMRDNAHRFGFILRYGDGMEYITGYKFEPWHYRYVGVDAATFIYENDLTFEEYYAYYVKNKPPSGSFTAKKKQPLTAFSLARSRAISLRSYYLTSLVTSLSAKSAAPDNACTWCHSRSISTPQEAVNSVYDVSTFESAGTGRRCLRDQLYIGLTLS